MVFYIYKASFLNFKKDMPIQVTQLYIPVTG